MRVAIWTLGCKVNQYESQAMEQALTARGHTLVPFGAEADACIVNSCSVTATADKKSRNALRRVKKQNPGTLAALCGCYSQLDPAGAAALGADLVGGSFGRMDFLDRLEALAAGKLTAPHVAVDQALKRTCIERLPAGGLEGRTRALLKIEDGCQNFCSYCIIPYARGPVRSLPLDEVEGEARRLQAAGYREMILTGIEISSYGRDLPGQPSLMDAVEAAHRGAPELRLRIGSLEPRTVTEDFCRRLAQIPNFCPHFHLSLQSGCDATLSKMKRLYDAARYRESVAMLRRHFDDPGITTDLIVGFPGETEADFEASLAFAEECGFSAMHVFPYSPRKGTPAASMEGAVAKGVKEQRVARAMELAQRMSGAWLDRQLGRVLSVLPEGGGEDFAARGHAPQYATVEWTGPVPAGVPVLVKITGRNGDVLTGVIEEE